MPAARAARRRPTAGRRGGDRARAGTTGWAPTASAPAAAGPAAGIEVPTRPATVEELAAAIRAVLDEPDYRRNAQRIAAEIAAAGGAPGPPARLLARAARGWAG